MTKLVVIVVLCCVVFAGVVRADLADDVARAEREIEVRRIAKGIFERAGKRSWAAVEKSSLYRDYEVASEKCDPADKQLEKLAEGKSGVTFLHREAFGITNQRDRTGVLAILEKANKRLDAKLAEYRACAEKRDAILRELEDLNATLRAQFIAEEVDRHLEELRNDVERKLLRKEIERLSI